LKRKKKGIACERELVHKLWDLGFGAVRIAGSGCTKTPSADIVAGRAGKVYTIECKSSKSENYYLDKSVVEQLLEFSRRFDSTPLIGIRFKNQEWAFLKIEHLPLFKDTGKFFVIGSSDISGRCIRLDKL